MYIRNDSIIYKYYKENNIKFKSIKDNQIIDDILFKKEMLYIIRKEKINSSLFGDVLYFISNNSYIENIKLKEIFNELGFQNTYIYSMYDILEKNKTYILDNKKDITIIYNDKSYTMTYINNKLIYQYITELIEKEMITIPIYYIQTDNIDRIEYLIKNKIKILDIYSPNDYIINKFEKKVTNM